GGGGAGAGTGTSGNNSSSFGNQLNATSNNNSLGGASGSNASSQSTTPVSASPSPSTGGFVQADPATNSLIITAPDPLYRQIRNVIDQLDGRRAQVYVESMIVKVDVSKSGNFGFQWQNLFGKTVGLGTNFGTGSANIITDSVATASNNSTTIGTALQSAQQGLNFAVFKKIAGVYTLGALANFLESQTGANVLSTPNLVALDNEEAKIVIGQNVPFVTGTYTTSTTGTSSPFQTVDRKDVGLTLRIRSQIGENGTIRMTVYQENSSVVAGTSSSTNGPTTDKSAIETTVTVDDGSIIVLGGLLKDEYSDGEDGVPGLASLPLVGNLFKSNNRKRIKTNLMVFLRPVVLRDQATADQLTLDRYDSIRAVQQATVPAKTAVLPDTGAPVVPANPNSSPLSIKEQNAGSPTEPAKDR
ncbi:secretin N-terminal domain-containing protein, partial [Pelomonas sp. KK5]|uniref:secretin N-terminal domain-containing protein n=1 Tax=Pelomonas sp. KK5 TaxID=1855730 RepID=UPI0026F42092